jgi:hypothetical protein
MCSQNSRQSQLELYIIINRGVWVVGAGWVVNHRNNRYKKPYSVTLLDNLLLQCTVSLNTIVVHLCPIVINFILVQLAICGIIQGCQIAEFIL